MWYVNKWLSSYLFLFWTVVVLHEFYIKLFKYLFTHLLTMSNGIQKQQGVKLNRFV